MYWCEIYLWIIWLLLLGGFVVGWLYLKIGKLVEVGNNLLIDEIYDLKKVILLCMVLLVLFGIVMLYLFGVFVGCEGMVV